MNHRSVILYDSPFVPPEWIAAHGLQPRRVAPSARAGLEGALGLAGLEEGLCPRARAFVAMALRPAPDLAGVVLASTCDQLRRLSEAAAQAAPVPVFAMHIPVTHLTSGPHRLFREELRRLGVFLERAGGRAPGEAVLAESLRQYDAARRSLREWESFLPPGAWAAAVRAWLESGALPSGSPVGVPQPRAGIPLALLGGELFEEDFALYSRVEAAGGRLALDATDAGRRSWPRSYHRRRLLEEPFEEMADAHFAEAAGAFRRPNTHLYRFLEKKMEEKEIRGFLFLRRRWCDIWNAEIQRLRAWSGKPVLVLETGEANGLEARTESRIQAFMETLR